MSRLLINENPLQVLPGLACAIGLNEAIVLQQIHYWMKNSQHFHDGRLWVYNSVPDWQAQFPFWSDSTVKRALSSLEKQGLVFTGNYNDDSWDKTKWYSIDYQRVDALEANGKSVTDRSGQNDHIDDVKMPRPSGQDDLTPQVKMTSSLTENTTETTTEIIGESAEAVSPSLSAEKIDYQKILDVYHDILPEMAQVKILTDARKKTIRGFWKKFKFTSDRWEAYLRYISGNCRWMLEDRPNGRGGFWKRKNLDYLVTERCYVSVKEERANDQ
ncbi:replication protein RepO [Pectobacterium brasiliense]|uniref:replication protein RepO n=1 Tax=Pectobacterium brasiliense TaxID=180957 RepID=UPI001969A61D|nr:replication protein RepO [Pectobacterium brasiliense]MBN3344880.1 replication protein RepO [Pectobacterium brasiliense]